MSDKSELDRKYFIDPHVYNCPFCNRRNVKYEMVGRSSFDWSEDKTCYLWFVKCSSCSKKSMHLSYEDISSDYNDRMLHDEIDIDSEIFYSVPTSFFTIDNRIPKVLRELISEGEGCIKMNYLTGASACVRKAIYELTILQDAEGADYESRIKSLKSKYPNIDSELFDVLCHIKDMTSDKMHEQSWDKWDSGHLKLFIETLKTILHEIYVLPDEKKSRSNSVRSMLEKVKSKTAKK